VLQTLEAIQMDFTRVQSGGKKVSLADLIVMAGDAAIELAAKNAGHDVKIPFRPGRTDASQAMTDTESFTVLEPDADAFRNFIGEGHEVPAEHLMIERAFRLTLSAPEMTVLIGGMRALGANTDSSNVGVLTRKPGTLTNDFFVNLLDMDTEWVPTSGEAKTFTGRGRSRGDARWTASRVDLVFGSHSELRAYSEVYATDDAKGKFVNDFVAAWTKVMNLDRFDIGSSATGPTFS
jgi:catalase-peroxidase